MAPFSRSPVRRARNLPGSKSQIAGARPAAAPVTLPPGISRLKFPVFSLLAHGSGRKFVSHKDLALKFLLGKKLPTLLRRDLPAKRHWRRLRRPVRSELCPRILGSFFVEIHRFSEGGGVPCGSQIPQQREGVCQGRTPSISIVRLFAEKEARSGRTGVQSSEPHSGTRYGLTRRAVFLL